MRNKNEQDPNKPLGVFRDLKDEARKKAQGEMQRWMFAANGSLIFLEIARKPSSFSELTKITKLGEPTVWKHLKYLQDCGFIYKDTIKANESVVQEVGKIVYRAVPDKWEDFFRFGLETSLGFLGRYFHGNVKAKRKMEDEIDRFVFAMVQIILEDTEELRKRVAKKYGWKK